MASRALLKSMACSCFFANLYSTPSVLVSFTFFFESNTFWSWGNRQSINEVTSCSSWNQAWWEVMSLAVMSRCWLAHWTQTLAGSQSTHLVYRDDVVGSHSEQPHVWRSGSKSNNHILKLKSLLQPFEWLLKPFPLDLHLYCHNTNSNFTTTNIISTLVSFFSSLFLTNAYLSLMTWL